MSLFCHFQDLRHVKSRRQALNIDLILHFALNLIPILQRTLGLDRTSRMMLVSSEGTPDTWVPIT